MTPPADRLAEIASHYDEGACCAHMRVRCRTEEERPGFVVRLWWECSECGYEFVPKAELARVTAENARLRDLGTEMVEHFVHEGHPGRPCLQSGWVRVETVRAWRAALAGEAPLERQEGS